MATTSASAGQRFLTYKGIVAQEALRDNRPIQAAFFKIHNPIRRRPPETPFRHQMANLNANQKDWRQAFACFRPDR
jgi:hypothetical protein